MLHPAQKVCIFERKAWRKGCGKIFKAVETFLVRYNLYLSASLNPYVSSSVILWVHVVFREELKTFFHRKIFLKGVK